MGRGLYNIMEIGLYKAKYVGKSMQGFKKNTIYTFKLNHKKNSCYEIEELNDDLYLVLSSETSMRQNFKDIEKID